MNAFVRRIYYGGRPSGLTSRQVFMAMSNSVIELERPSGQPWLRSSGWDLSFLILSIFIAAVPYSIFVIFGGRALLTADLPGTGAYKARVLVNSLVAVFIGGPHMYATFTRTILDPQFLRERFRFIASSFLIPVAVFTMAIWTYQTYVWLLTIFFAMASVHALHQLVWLTEAYHRKGHGRSSIASRLIDYGVVVTSLYPIAVWKMAEGRFKIGPVALKFNELLADQWWLAYLASALFLVMLGAFIVKTVLEIRASHVNLPKTLLISLTVMLMFWTPFFPNMDTSFQGINVWHSFQYLALTWHANRLREQLTHKPLGFVRILWRGGLQGVDEGGDRETGFPGRLGRGVVNGLRRVDRGTGWTTFYLLCMAMLTFSGVLILFAKASWPNLHAGLPGADEAYAYMGILSILLVHYVQDGLLFFHPESLTG
jgi:hypothetical protein